MIAETILCAKIFYEFQVVLLIDFSFRIKKGRKIKNSNWEKTYILRPVADLPYARP